MYRVKIKKENTFKRKIFKRRDGREVEKVGKEKKKGKNKRKEKRKIMKKRVSEAKQKREKFLHFWKATSYWALEGLQILKSIIYPQNI